MKQTLIYIALSIVLCNTLLSQTNKEEIDLYQSLYGMEKKAIVAEFISLEGEAYNSFWTLYDQYETERKVIGAKRFELVDKYAENYLTLDDLKTDELLKESISLNNQAAKLRQKYTKSIRKAAGVKAAAQFYQLENYFASEIHVALMEQIPFIGELEK